MTSLSSHLGERLAELLKERKITQAEFAKKLEVAPQQVSRWCQTASFQWHLVQRFSKVIGITEAEFLGLK